jgi:hypothetical protein
MHFTRPINRNNYLSVDYFDNIFENINEYINKIFYKNHNEYCVFAVDGTDGNLRSKLIDNQFKLKY